MRSSRRAPPALPPRAPGARPPRVWTPRPQALDAREQQLDAELVRLRAARLRVIADSDPKLIEQYEKIATRRRPAAVRIRGTLCLGCRVDIPPQQCIEIQRAERVITCGNCQRILLGIDRA